MSFCKIVYVSHRGRAGWQWQSVAPQGKTRVSDQRYPLFYECVLAARASGYTPTPELKCS